MAPRTAARALARRPLVVTDDPDLLDDLLGIASRAGVEPDVAPDPATASKRYPQAPIVLVGAGSAAGCRQAGLPRRPGVVLVGFAASAEPPWEAADLIGAEHVALLPAAHSWLVDRLAETLGPAASAAGRVVAVLGGRGGAGASVLAAGLAVTGARAGLRALLLDGDPLGGGVDLVLGWEALDGLRWPALSQTSGSVSPPALSAALPTQGDLTALSWDRGKLLEIPPAAMASALEAGCRDRQLVVADLPRRLDDAATLALAAADLTLLVVPAELRACAAAARVVASIAEYSDTVTLVVRGPAPGGLRVREIARSLGLPVIGTLRPEPGLARGLERGEPPAGKGRGPLAALCDHILAELGLKPEAAA